MIIDIKNAPKKFKVLLIKELGYKTDGYYVKDKNGKILRDKYTNDKIKIDNMMIFPGKNGPLILDDNVFSVLEYVEEYGDRLLKQIKAQNNSQ